MSTKFEKNMEDIFNLPEKIEDVNNKNEIKPVDNIDETVDNDFKYARENLYNLVERWQDAIDGILELSKETEHPRAYEVAGQLIKTVGETAEKLIDLQSKLKKLEGEEQKVGTQHNHLYVGSTSELQKFLKKKNVKE